MFHEPSTILAIQIQDWSWQHQALQSIWTVVLSNLSTTATHCLPQDCMNQGFIQWRLSAASQDQETPGQDCFFPLSQVITLFLHYYKQRNMYARKYDVDLQPFNGARWVDVKLRECWLLNIDRLKACAEQHKNTAPLHGFILRTINVTRSVIGQL